MCLDVGEPLGADSLVLNPKATVHQKAFSDSIVVRPQGLKDTLRSVESLPSPPKSKWLKWRWPKRNPFKSNPTKDDISGMESIAEMDRCKSDEVKIPEKDIFKDLMESQRRVPSMESSEQQAPTTDADGGQSSDKIIKGHTGTPNLPLLIFT